MFHIINEELISEVATGMKSNAFGDFYGTDYLSVTTLPREDSGRSGEYKKIILKASVDSTTESTVSPREMPIEIRAKMTTVGNTQNILLVKNKEVKYDADVFLAAIPFNGSIKPIALNKDFHIYKAMIVNAADRITFRDDRYKKILYLVFVAMPTALTASNPHFHKDETVLTVESFMNSRENEDVSTKNTFTFRYFELPAKNVPEGSHKPQSSKGKFDFSYQFDQEQSTYYDNTEFKDVPLYPMYVPRKYDAAKDQQSQIQGLKNAGFIIK